MIDILKHGRGVLIHRIRKYLKKSDSEMVTPDHVYDIIIRKPQKDFDEILIKDLGLYHYVFVLPSRIHRKQRNR